jgi:hypothetical protein
MTPATPKQNYQRGGASVGHLSELPEVERGAVLFLRQWCLGDAARAVIARDFALAFGSERGAATNALQDRLMQVMLGRARRPLMRHADGCACLGGDESAFAQMVAAAASGDLEDASMFAMTLIAAPAVPEAVALAEELGLAYAEIFTPLALSFGRDRPTRSH